MNRRELWCERTTSFRKKNFGAWQRVSYLARSRRLRRRSEIGFRIANDRFAGYSRQVNRSPSMAVASGDSQKQPSSPPTAYAGEDIETK
jgi:hypothetical protein